MTVREIPRRLMQWMVWVYQATLSPYVGRQCRFYPTCSHYAYEAIGEHGALKGLSLSVRRLLRCHPFHAGGVDPVPVREEK